MTDKSAPPAGPQHDLNDVFSAWFRGARRNAGLSQQKAADALAARGFSFGQSTIAKIERNERPVRLDEAAAMTELFGATLDQALGLKPSQGPYGSRTAARQTALLQRVRDSIDAELRGGAS